MKCAGILVRSRRSGARVQSSRLLQLSASLFHDSHTALPQRSLVPPTMALIFSWIELFELTGPRDAITLAAVPTRTMILPRYCVVLREFECGGQKAKSSHASPFLGEGGNQVFIYPPETAVSW